MYMFPIFEPNSTSLNESLKKGDEYKAHDVFRKHCSWWNENATQLYKPIKKAITAQTGNSEYLFVSSLGEVRKFKNYEYVQRLISKMNNWKQFPLYSKSIIVTTNRYIISDSEIKKSEYDLYRVIPYTDTRLCIAPNASFDISFRSFFEEIDVSSVREINNLIEHLLEKTDENDNLIKRFNSIKNQKIEQEILSSKGVSSSMKKFLQELSSYQGTSLQFLAEKLDPNKNGFQTKDLKNSFSVKGKKEIWFQGKALLVKESYFEKFIAIQRV